MDFKIVQDPVPVYILQCFFVHPFFGIIGIKRYSQLFYLILFIMILKNYTHLGSIPTGCKSIGKYLSSKYKKL